MIETFLITKLGERFGKLAAAALPWVGLALAVLAAWLLAVGHGKSVQKAKDQVTIQRLTEQRDGYKANQDKLTAALNKQNAAVDALRKEGDQRVADGKKALEQARQANQGLQNQAAALRKSATRKVDGPPCAVSDTLKQVGSI